MRVPTVFDVSNRLSIRSIDRSFVLKSIELRIYQTGRRDSIAEANRFHRFLTYEDWRVDKKDVASFPWRNLKNKNELLSDSIECKKRLRPRADWTSTSPFLDPTALLDRFATRPYSDRSPRAIRLCRRRLAFQLIEPRRPARRLRSTNRILSLPTCDKWGNGNEFAAIDSPHVCYP